jgi:Rrf2 family transcriptional regulator, iron-sulfur cluster assembly transcription factor
MDMKLGKRADYTVRAVLDLARHHGHGRRKTADIAEEMQVPVTYLPQLLAELVREGIVRSMAGRHGGYELARDPAEVSLLEVIEVADGPLVSTECVLRGGPCRWEEACAIHEPWARAQEAMRDELRATTFAEVAALDVALNGSSAAGAPRPPAVQR